MIWFNKDLKFENMYPLGKGTIGEHIGMEWVELGQLLTEVRTGLLAELQPQGFNIGVNDGAVAGQTITHFHLHLIPRYPADQRDPRGGVRWIFPDKAKYW